MTDSQYHEEPTKVEPVVVPAPVEEFDPMKLPLNDLFARAREWYNLDKRFAALEDKFAKLSDSLAAVTAERDSLKAENGNLDDEVRASRNRLEEKEATLEHQRSQTLAYRRKYDETLESYNDAKAKLDDAERSFKDKFEHAEDERDTAVLDLKQAHRERDETAAELAKVDKEFHGAKEEWFNLENQLNETIQRLSSEKDKAEEKVAKWTSFAATIMRDERVSRE